MELDVNDNCVTPVNKQEQIMFDDVKRSRLIGNPVKTDKTLPMKLVDSSALQTNGYELLITKTPADDPGHETFIGCDAVALKLISKNDVGDKPMRTEASRDKNGPPVKARRPDVLTLSPLSPSDTDEDNKTPRPLSGSYRSSDVTPVAEFSFVELPSRFRQYPDVNSTVNVPELILHDADGTSKHLDTDGTSKHQYQTETQESRVDCTRQETRDVDDTSGDVSDDISIALQWIQQELRQMKMTDRTLVRQFLDLGASIHQLRGLTDCRSFNTDESTDTGGDRTPDWEGAAQKSDSADLCILPLSSPAMTKKKKTKSGKRANNLMKGRRSLESVSSTTGHTDQKEFYV